MRRRSHCCFLDDAVEHDKRVEANVEWSVPILPSSTVRKKSSIRKNECRPRDWCEEDEEHRSDERKSFEEKSNGNSPKKSPA